MSFTEEVIDSMNRLHNFQAIQGSIRSSAFRSGVPYFAFARGAQMVQDMFMKALQAGNIGAIQNEIPNLLGSNFDVATDLIGKEGADAVFILKKAIENNYKGLYDNWKAGIWHGVGSAYSSAMEQFLGTGDLLWAYKHLMHRIAVTPKMARHWNEVYRPTMPNTSMAFNLWKKDFITEKDFEKLAGYEGWPKKYIDKLKFSLGAYPSAHMAFRLMARGFMPEKTYKLYLKYAGWPEFKTGGWDEAFKILYAWWPSAKEAFYMWKRGLLSDTERDMHYKGQGYTPEIMKKLTETFEKWPNARAAYRMKLRGKLTDAQFKKYVEAEGWPKDFDQKIAAVYQWWPSAKEAFYMWKRGIIDAPTRDKFYQGQGYPTWLYANLTKSFEYLPSLYDLIRIADYQEVDIIWATRVMQERGMRTKDISKFIEYLRYRPLREEIRDITRQLVWRYQFGRISPTAMAAELQELPIGATERELITDYAEMKYEDELITEQVFILKWQFRMGWITEANYLAGLISLGFREEKANLMVEQEKAQGYFGYY